MSWYRNLKLRPKFLVAFGLIMFVVAVQAAVTKQALDDNDAAEGRAAKATDLGNATWEARTVVRGFESHYRGYLISADPAILADIDQDRALYADVIADLRSLTAGNPELETTVDRIDEAATTWITQVVDPGIAFRQANAAADLSVADLIDRTTALATITVQDETLRSMFEDTVAQADSDLAAAQGASDAASERLARVVLSLTLLVFVLCILMVLYLSAIIAEPLERITTRAIRIGDGDFDIDKTGIIRRDEVGEVAASFDATIDTLRTVSGQADAIAGGRLSAPGLDDPIPGALGESFTGMVTYLREIRTVAADLSEGDLAGNVVVRSDEDELGRSLQAMTHNLRSTVDDVRNVAEYVGTGTMALAEGSEESAHLATEVAAAVNGITEGIALQTRATEEVSSSVEAIAAEVRAATVAVAEAAESSRRAAELGDSGRDNVDRVISSMSSIDTALDATNTSVEQLQEHSRRVGDIVELIQAIADQTNLLALNAAIEAARAGEAGRGFAVVADEIKALAEQATESTREVAKVVERMVDQVDHVQAAMFEGRTAVDGGRDAVESAGVTFQSIAGGIDAITSQMAHVDAAVHRIDDSAHRINERTTELVQVSNSNSAAVERVAAASEQTAATAEEIGATAQEIASGGEQLQQAVARFSLRRAGETRVERRRQRAYEAAAGTRPSGDESPGTTPGLIDASTNGGESATERREPETAATPTSSADPGSAPGS
jgi:methyl-accepting chemotaxis protein